MGNLSLHGPIAHLLMQMVLIILCSQVLHRLMRRLWQPRVVTEVLAGILLGPSLFGWLAPRAYSAVFTADSLPGLSLTSQLGIVLFMFVVGLEFDPAMMRERARAAFAVSHASIVVPFGLGVLLSVPFFPHWAPAGASRLAFALFLGASMSVTAFPVLARILTEQKLLGTRLGTTALTCAAVDDLTAWCLLAFVVTSATPNGHGAALMTSCSALAYIAVMVFAVKPLLARWAARETLVQPVTRGTLAAAAVGLFASSLATEAIGIHALFGAFLFGVIWPKRAGFAAGLATAIEPVVGAVLLPLFFAYSGIRTQLGLLDSRAAWTACLVIIAAACLGKFGASAVAGRASGLSWREASALGVLMNTRGLMELVVLNLGLDLGVIGPALFSMMVVMALVTTFAAAPVVRLIYPTSRAASSEVAVSSVTTAIDVSP